MFKKKALLLSILPALILSFAAPSRAEDISVTIRKQIKEIAKLGTNPKATEADKKKMEELYAKVRGQGMNAVPVLEEVLLSKDNVAEKKASLYLVAQIYNPATAEEADRKGALMLKYFKIALADASEEVRGLALQMVSGLWHTETYPTLLEFFKTNKDSGARVFALSRMAAYQTENSYKDIVSAMSDPDPAVQKAAVEYKAYRDDLKVKAAQLAAASETKNTEKGSKGYGKRAY